MELQKEGISFEINESLYFENGQEIEEMLGISLDPDITLQMYEGYVQIRGIILLQGEYQKSNRDTFHQTERDMNTTFIEKVMDKNENEAFFTHRFPLDISIPNDRVDKLEDVSVVVSEFDYELPDIHTLKVKAAILISGLIEDTKTETSEQQTNDRQNKSEKEKQDNVNMTPENEGAEQLQPTAEPEIPGTLEPPVGETEQQEQEEAVKTGEIDIQYKESEGEDEEDNIGDVQFLTDLFGGGDQEDHTKLKIYITQPEDTIESIAQHYGIPALQLMKDNHLGMEGVAAGTLLHIQVEEEEEEKEA